MDNHLNKVLMMLDQSLRVEGSKVNVIDETKLRTKIDKLVEVIDMETGALHGWANFLTRAAALELGIIPASIHEMYMARGRGEVPLTFSVPAINLRVLSFEAAKAVLRAARKIDAGAIIFEIARSEIGYTSQSPVEYATNVLAAAIAEGFRGPIFIQGDHFQISAKRYAGDSLTELNAVRNLTREAIEAGFFNIDIDSSTLVDINKATISEQQILNYSLSAMYAAFIREIEPKGITISIGGEIGEVGKHNSTEAELHTYMEGFNVELEKRVPGSAGLSKISIQTGTSHGGVVLPNGSIAEVKVDFKTLRDLSRVARSEFGLGGTVQHGASTLPEDAFGKFVESEACEVHLATNFMNMFFDRAPVGLRQEMYSWLDVNQGTERKADMTDEQFYYKTRKNALGPYKSKINALPASFKHELGLAWEAQFDKLFRLLGLADTRQYVEKYIKTVAVQPSLNTYLGKGNSGEEVGDLAD